MKTAEQERLLDKLIDLMTLHDKEWRGVPYVAEDGSFGLIGGPKKGSLYGAYFLLDKLSEGGLLKERVPNQDLDTAVYTLSWDKQFEVYKGAKLFWNDDKVLQVTVSTKQPVSEVIKAIDKGIERAQEEHRRAIRAELKYMEERRADKLRDKMGPVFGPEVDAAFVKTYLSMRIEEQFPGSQPCVKASRRDPELEKAINDTRPVMVAEYDHPEGENYRRDNELRDGLTKVFNGFCAVDGNQFREDRMEFSIVGPPARLAADILDHDPQGAKKAAALLAPQYPAKVKDLIAKTVKAHASAAKA